MEYLLTIPKDIDNNNNNKTELKSIVIFAHGRLFFQHLKLIFIDPMSYDIIEKLKITICLTIITLPTFSAILM